MASDVDISNLALSLIGSDAVVTALSDSTPEAGFCKRFLPMARRELLDAHPFTFAKKRALLAEVTNPSDVWAYAYALPSDCITPKRVLQAVDYTWPWQLDNTSWAVTADVLNAFAERGSAEFEVEGLTVLTHEPEAVLLYVADPTGRTSPKFETALGHLLAAYLAGPIIKGSEGVKAMANLRQLVFGASGRTGLAGEAFQVDARKSSETHAFTPAGIRARA